MSLLGNGSTTSGLAKVTRLKQGGRAPFALLQGRGVGRCGSPGAQPDLCLHCFTTVPNLGCPKATSGVTSKLSASPFGGNGTDPIQRARGPVHATVTYRARAP